MEAGTGSLVELRLSAPGKVILFGEHSVVYGKTALAASLDVRSTLSLRELPSESELCEIELPRVKLSLRLAVGPLRQALLLEEKQVDEQEQQQEQQTEEELHEELLRRAQEHARVAGPGLESREVRSLVCVLYALARAGRTEGLRLGRAFRLELDSELPLGGGLGSSASFAVCLAAGFMLWARLRAGHPGVLGPDELRRVSRHALACERITHGSPSGVDTEVCTFGAMLEFRRAEAASPRSLALPAALAGLRLLLVDTGVARSTKALVESLREHNDRYPDIFAAFFESMDKLCRRAIDLLGNVDTDADEYADVDALEVSRQLALMVDANQGLLQACRVSHPSINLICSIANKHGLSAKLTGAGGGGFVYVLVPLSASDFLVQLLTSDLHAEGFNVIETSLAGPGLIVHEASLVETSPASIPQGQAQINQNEPT